MKKFLVWLLILAGIPVFAEEVSLDNVQAEKIQLPKANITTKQSLVVNDKQILDELIQLQKEKDVEDIENLWKGTVENNQVIGFALKKLSTPESQRRIHSSLMAKTLSAVVAGASLLSLIKDDTLAIILDNLMIFGTGILISFITGLLCISFLLKYIKKNDFKIFMIYRILLGILILFILWQR